MLATGLNKNRSRHFPGTVAKVVVYGDAARCQDQQRYNKKHPYVPDYPHDQFSEYKSIDKTTYKR
jgi:hypothetical protein